MLDNPLLEAKYNVQKKLNEKAEDDLTKYVEYIHHIVKEMSREYEIQFTYGKLKESKKK